MAQSKKKPNKPESSHSPRLSTILMVEKVLRDNADRIIKPAELKRMLPKKVNHNTLMSIVDYLDRSNKIAFTSRGMMWIVNDSPKLRKAIAEGTLH
ncbi:MAG TPA: hypothetical protein VJ461_03190 [Candidatus Nanoarchaeia archaeon]|nr:hypothetical protein [Candidatus Nanoarchaeia archaeon]